MSTLIELLAAELERPRELSPRVVRYISGSYDVEREDIGAFLVSGLLQLEDYEIDLILSPVFSPKLADEAVFAERLGADAAPREEWPALIKQLAERPTYGHLVTEDGVDHPVILREVTIERYVHRVRLDGKIPRALFELIAQAPPQDHPMLKAIARRPVWETGAARNILEQYLRNSIQQNSYTLADSIALLELVEAYKPANLEEIQLRIPQRQLTVRREIDMSGRSKPFFSPRVEQMHGGGRDQRQPDEGRVSAKEKELAFLQRMQEALS